MNFFLPVIRLSTPNTLFPSDKFSHANDLLFYIQDFLQQNKLENNWKYSPDIIII